MLTLNRLVIPVSALKCLTHGRQNSCLQKFKTIFLQAVQPPYNSHPWDSKKVAVVGRSPLWRGQIYSKTALLGYYTLAVIGRWLLLRGDRSWRFHIENLKTRGQTT